MGKSINKLIKCSFTFIFIILFLSFVNAQKITVSANVDGLDIIFPLVDAIEIDRPFEFIFHIFNKSDGMPFSEDEDIGCYFHVYNTFNEHTATLFQNNTCHLWDYEFNIDENNFTVLGTHSYILQCNNTRAGGFISTDFLVTNNGRVSSTKESIAYFTLIIALFILIILGIYFSITLPGGDLIDENYEIISVKSMKYVKFLSMVLTYLLSVWLMFLLREISSVLILMNGATRLFHMMFMTMVILIAPLFIAGITFVVILILRDRNTIRRIARGLPNNVMGR